MNPTYYLAIDMGASSGRHILGWLENGRIRLEEVHRFENGAKEKDGSLVWDVDGLFAEILKGLKLVAGSGRKPVSVGIDTWGVDFALLDANGARLGEAVAYRDARTKGMIEKVSEILDDRRLYARIGIQSLIFNTIFQLVALRQQRPEQLSRASSLLMLPDYFGYRLTGARANEYTNATTGGLVDPKTKNWDWGLVQMLGLPVGMFSDIVAPGHVLGRFTPEVHEAVGFDADVVLPPSHDTAAAVLAMPAVGEGAIFLSSGTWSLMGIERREADCREECRQAGFTNEGGYDRYCFLKNIMGMWVIQGLRGGLREKLDFNQTAQLAEANLRFPSIVDVNDHIFMAPKSMAEAFREFCARTGQTKPETDGELLACAYNSLAKSYSDTAEAIDRLTGRRHDRIHIMGGGSQDGLLNRLTARFTGREVYTGPVEATAIGNLLSQMLRHGKFADLEEARAAVRQSFEVGKVEE